MDIQTLNDLVQFVEENIPRKDSSMLIIFKDNTFSTVQYAGSDYSAKMYETIKSEIRNAICYKTINGTEIAQPLFKICDTKDCLKEYLRTYIQIALEMKEDDITVGINIYNKNNRHFYINVAADREMIYLEEEY